MLPIVLLFLGLGYLLIRVNERIQEQSPDENPFGPDRLVPPQPVPVAVAMPMPALAGRMVPMLPLPAYALAGHTPPASPPPATFFPSGQLVRVTVRVDPHFIEAARAQGGQSALLDAVRERVLQMGFSNALAALQDPTDATVLTVIARVDPSAPRMQFSDVRIANLEALRETPETTPQGPAVEGPDPGLTRGEVGAIRHALLHEPNPRHLSGFATTLEPDFPVSASLLRAKGMLRETSAHRNRTLLMAEANKNATELADKVAKKAGPEAAKTTLAWMQHPPTAPPPALALADITLRAIPESSRGAWADVACSWDEACEKSPPCWFRIDRMAKVGADLQGAPQGAPQTNGHPLEAAAAALRTYAVRAGLTAEQLQEQLKRAICLLVQDTASLLRERGSEEAHHAIMQTLAGFPPAIVQAAQQAVREVGLGIFVIDPDTWKAICPPPTAKTGFIPEAALQLAQSAGKPQMSRVANPAMIPHRYQQLRANTPDAVKAALNVSKAEKSLERGKWVRWYRQRAESNLGL